MNRSGHCRISRKGEYSARSYLTWREIRHGAKHVDGMVALWASEEISRSIRLQTHICAVCTPFCCISQQGLTDACHIRKVNTFGIYRGFIVRVVEGFLLAKFGKCQSNLHY